MRKVLLLGNSEIVIYNFRLELIESLLQKGYEVFLSFPNISGKAGEEKIDELIHLGCNYEPIKINRHGLNPFEDIKLFREYKKLFKKIEPNIIFSYTIKPNIYGALAAGYLKIPFVANITGLGSAVEKPGPLQHMIIALYKISFRKIQTVFFQNKENRQFFIDNKIAIGRHKLLPGSGVNLKYFKPIAYPSDETIEFVFISRIMKEKGIDQYLKAAEFITKKYPNTKFHVCGFCEEKYEEILESFHSKGIIIYHGMVTDVRKIIRWTHCTVLPSFYPEGISNVLLESAASGRPVISTDRSGCKEAIDDELSGYIIKQKDSTDLINKIERFLNMSNEDRKNMGILGREKMEQQFDRRIVVHEYLNQIK